MKKTAVLVGMLLLLSCGGTGDKEQFMEDALSSAVVISDVVGVEDLQTDLNLTPYLLSPPAFSPPFTSPSPQYSNPLLPLLSPRPVKRRRILLRIARAPLRVSHHYAALFYAKVVPACVSVSQEGNCPVTTPGDTCEWSFEFSESGCDEPVFLNGATATINFTGSITASVVLLSDNVISVTTFPASLKIEAEDGKYIVIDGVSKGTFEIGILGYTFTLEAENLHFEDSEGRKGVINGVRTVEVDYGRSINISANAVVNITSPEGEEHTLQFDVDREVTFRLKGKTISVTDVTVVDGDTFTRTYTLDVTKEFNEGEVLKEIILDGSGTFEGPLRELSIKVDELALDLNCDRNPRGGSIEITGAEHTAVITFEDNCSCFAWVSIDGGEPEKVDLCERRGF